MPKAKKLPSGNWRVRAYDKETKKYRSFTAETKKESELMALQAFPDSFIKCTRIICTTSALAIIVIF